MALTTEHEIAIDSLSSGTTYRYTIGNADSVIQGGPDNFFVTYPDINASKKLRFWITGDCGNNSVNQRRVRDEYLNYVKGERTDGWLLLGDNAYFDGTDQEYQNNFFEVYQGNIMKNTFLWPSPGNHDYADEPVLQMTRNIPYYDIFTLPTKGEAGGTASGSESYYSYDVGNVHFVSLDSYGMDEGGFRLYDSLGPQVEWLKKDLANNHKMWTVAYWHHPPYTKGSHDSDTEGELVLIRKNTIRILERFNVDVVLGGHSHSYERTRLIANHFNNSNTFDRHQHEADSSSARYDGTSNSCPYIKNESQKGTVYVVAGSAGQVGGSTGGFPHRAMYYSNRTMGGSGILEIENNRLDFKWLTSSGVVEDNFTIIKNAGITTEQTAGLVEPITLTASWGGKYQWQSDPNLASRSISADIHGDSLFVVRDEYGCLADSMKMKVDVATEVSRAQPSISIYPNPAEEKFSIDIVTSEFYSVDILDALGRIIMQQNLGLHNTIERGNLPPGVYLLVLVSENRVIRRKILLR